jgi:hypothetical protein
MELVSHRRIPTVIPARAFEGLPNIKELDYCHIDIGVKKVE